MRVWKDWSVPWERERQAFAWLRIVCVVIVVGALVLFQYLDSPSKHWQSAFVVIIGLLAMWWANGPSRRTIYYLEQIKPHKPNHFSIVVDVYVDVSRQFTTMEGNATRLRVPYCVVAVNRKHSPLFPPGKWRHYQRVKVDTLDMEALGRGAVLVFDNLEPSTTPEDPDAKIKSIYEKMKSGS